MRDIVLVQYPWDVIKKAHAEGLVNVHVPEEVRFHPFLTPSR
jgi:hypothetical protein